MSALVDTNVLVRHLTGDPPDMARRATAYLVGAQSLLLTDVVLAETVLVMESVYGAPRRRLAEAMRALLVLPTVAVVDQPLLLRTLELYEETRLHLVDAYLVACAESTGVGSVASFDRGIDRVGTVERIEPWAG